MMRTDEAFKHQQASFRRWLGCCRHLGCAADPNEPDGAAAAQSVIIQDCGALALNADLRLPDPEFAFFIRCSRDFKS